MYEDEIIEHVLAVSADRSPGITIASGDDAAELTIDHNRLLVCVDQVVEGRHFTRDTASYLEIGYKSVARAISDIAAMAGTPTAVLASVALPPDMGSDDARDLVNAVNSAATYYGAVLIGGDTCIHDNEGRGLVISITVLAKSHPSGSITRAGAMKGDLIYVTGTVGGSLDADGRGGHLAFEARITPAIALADSVACRLHAMIDTSDGLGRDACRISSASQVKLVIETSAIPCKKGLSWKEAAVHGEDYELLFCAAGDVPSIIDGIPVTCIGEVKSGRGACFIDDGKCMDASSFGWEHATS